MSTLRNQNITIIHRQHITNKSLIKKNRSMA